MAHFKAGWPVCKAVQQYFAHGMHMCIMYIVHHSHAISQLERIVVIFNTI